MPVGSSDGLLMDVTSVHLAQSFAIHTDVAVMCTQDARSAEAEGDQSWVLSPPLVPATQRRANMAGEDVCVPSQTQPAGQVSVFWCHLFFKCTNTCVRLFMKQPDSAAHEQAAHTDTLSYQA